MILGMNGMTASTGLSLLPVTCPSRVTLARCLGIAVLILGASCTFNWVLDVGSFWMPDWIFPFFGF